MYVRLALPAKPDCVALLGLHAVLVGGWLTPWSHVAYCQSRVCVCVGEASLKMSRLTHYTLTNARTRTQMTGCEIMCTCRTHVCPYKPHRDEASHP